MFRLYVDLDESGDDVVKEHLPAIALTCSRCGHGWESRARVGTVLRCPECGHPRRIPAHARDATPPPAPPESRSAEPTRPPVSVRPVPTDVRTPTEPVRSTARLPAPALGPRPGSAAAPYVPTPGRAPWTDRVRSDPAQDSAGSTWAQMTLRYATAGLLGKAPSGRARPTAMPPVDPAALDRALSTSGLTRDPNTAAGACPITGCGRPARVLLMWHPAARLAVCDQCDRKIGALVTRLARSHPDSA